jgi:hypothetical protein
MHALTVKSEPRSLLMVLALAGDSTMTRFLDIRRRGVQVSGVSVWFD